MSLGGNFFTDSHESDKHFVIKMLIYKVLRNRGRVVWVEKDFGNAGIADVFDESEGLVYEIQGTFNKSIVEKKTFLYTKNVLVNDVIVIPLSRFVGTDFVEYLKILEEIIV